MKTLETPRLKLRPFTENDFEAVHAYASKLENLKYMPFGPNSEEDTRNFLGRTIAHYAAQPLLNYGYAVTLKTTGKLIGGCEITQDAEGLQGSLGWLLHRDYWKQGYGTELARELIRFGFEELKLHRISATCDSENYGSYRVMENNGMRREGYFIKKRSSRGEWRDEFLYAILDEDWEVQKEIRRCNALPCLFEEFYDFSGLTDGELELVCVEKKPAQPEIKHVPSYAFEIRKDSAAAGKISLRVGYTEGLYYGGADRVRR